jgi:hypothetical protein
MLVSCIILIAFLPNSGILKASASYYGTNYIIAAIMLHKYPNQQQLVTMYRHYLDSHDYVFGAYADRLYADLLPGVKVATWDSLAAIQQNAPTIKTKYGIPVIGFDLEQSLSPSRDLNNPVAVMQKASLIAHSYGLKFMAMPGYPLINANYASKIARYADSYVIQATCMAGYTPRYQSDVTQISHALRAAHPGIMILGGLSLHIASVNAIEECFNSVAYPYGTNAVDGVWPFYGLESNQVTLVNDFLSWFNYYYG